VEYLHEGTLHQVSVNQEVIVSAGAFDSPKLLLLSGIGDAAHLQALGLPVIADLPGVGQNLLDHVLVPITYQATWMLRQIYSVSQVPFCGHHLALTALVRDSLGLPL
jgi:choline dehydrogenase